MAKSYDCPHCGAIDSTTCAFQCSDRTGTVVPSQQKEARKVGCRVMHYTDLFKRTGSFKDEE